MAIRNKKYIVRLSQEEREALMKLVRGGKAAARKITRARVMLKADAGTGGPGWTDQRIAETLEVGVRTASLRAGRGFHRTVQVEDDPVEGSRRAGTDPPRQLNRSR